MDSKFASGIMSVRIPLFHWSSILAMTIGTKSTSALDDLLPDELRSLSDPQKDIPRIAKDRKLILKIEQAVQQIPSQHRLFNRDSRDMRELKPESVHLVVTSPPYWTLKEYRKTDG